MNLIECIMKGSTCYNGTTQGTPVGILWHDTSAGNPYLKRYVQPNALDPNYGVLMSMIGKNTYGNDYEHKSVQAGLNAWIGKLADGSIATAQTLPWDYRPWGCGKGSKGSCNGTTGGKFWIQFEIADDGYQSKDYFEKVYKEAVELTAYLCKKFGIDPNGTVSYNGVNVPTILCHQDAYKLGLGSNHSDVYPWFNKFGKTMSSVRADVKTALTPVASTPTANPTVATSDIRVGDVVKIVSGATYYSGRQIPQWVKDMNWIVRSVSGSRVVVDEDEDHKESICSAIDAKYLTVVSRAKVLEVGSVVKVASNAVWYSSGKAVPSWVKADQWVVHSISGSKVVIDKNKAGTNSICSAIDKKYLTVV